MKLLKKFFKKITDYISWLVASGNLFLMIAAYYFLSGKLIHGFAMMLLAIFAGIGYHGLKLLHELKVLNIYTKSMVNLQAINGKTQSDIWKEVRIIRHNEEYVG